MKIFKAIALSLSIVAATVASAADENALPAINGYDPVAYFSQNEAVRGSGFHTAEHAGQTYLFASEDNKKEFTKNPAKYAPQFGGFCAFGVSLGKKFYSDPTAFAVVGGKLYLNLNKEIQAKWNADQAQMIKKADGLWDKIKSKKVSSL